MRREGLRRLYARGCVAALAITVFAIAGAVPFVFVGEAGDPSGPKEGDVLPATIEQLEPGLTKRAFLDVPEGGDYVRFVYRAFPRRRFSQGRWIADPEVRAVHLFFTELDGRGAVRPIPVDQMAVAGLPLPPIDPAVRPGTAAGSAHATERKGDVEWTPSWSFWEEGTLVTFEWRPPRWNSPVDGEFPPWWTDPADPSVMPVTGVTFGLRARRRRGDPKDVPDVHTASFAMTGTTGPPDYPRIGGPAAAGAEPDRPPAFDLSRESGGPNTPHWFARVSRAAPVGLEVAFDVPDVQAPVVPRLVEGPDAPVVLVADGPSVVLRVPRVYANSGYRAYATSKPGWSKMLRHGFEGLTGERFDVRKWGVSILPSEGVFFPTQAFETVTLRRKAEAESPGPRNVWIVVEHVDAPYHDMPYDAWVIAYAPPLRVFLAASKDDWDGDGAPNATDAEPLDAAKK